jgi:hypothetical protein
MQAERNQPAEEHEDDDLLFAREFLEGCQPDRKKKNE